MCVDLGHVAHSKQTSPEERDVTACRRYFLSLGKATHFSINATDELTNQLIVAALRKNLFLFSAAP